MIIPLCKLNELLLEKIAPAKNWSRNIVIFVDFMFWHIYILDIYIYTFLGKSILSPLNCILVVRCFYILLIFQSTEGTEGSDLAFKMLHCTRSFGLGRCGNCKSAADMKS